MDTDRIVVLRRFKTRIMLYPRNRAVCILRIDNLIENNYRFFTSLYRVIGQVPRRDITATRYR